MTYEQIKQIAYSYQEWSSTTGNDYSFDLWASEPGKELIEKLNSTPNTDKLEQIRKQVEAAELLREGQTQSTKNSTAIFAYGNIAKIVTGVNPLVSLPSNSAPVSPDIRDHERYMTEREIMMANMSLKKPDRHEALVKGIKDEIITTCFKGEGIKKHQYNPLIDISARIAVKRMTEEFKAGYEQAASDYGYANAHNDSDINAYLIERGLIPEKEGGEDG